MAERTARPLKKKLLALAVSGLVSFVVAELATRTLLGSPLAERLPIMQMQANSLRGWQMVPSEVHYTYHHPVHVNAHGFRGPEIGPKRPETVRVVALGDSLVYGQGVADDETLPFYLERWLEADDTGRRDWEVINTGHRSYDTRQELRVLDELGRELEPDVVVLFWFWNDLFQRRIQDTYAWLAQVEPVAFDTSAKMEGWTRTSWQLKQFVRRSAFVMFAHDAIARKESKAFAPELRTNGRERARAHLERFLELSRKLEFVPLLVIIPDPNEVRGEFIAETLGDDTEASATALGLRTVRLLPSLRTWYEREGEVPVIPYDGHYLPEGNELMARDVARALLDALPL